SRATAEAQPDRAWEMEGTSELTVAEARAAIRELGDVVLHEIEGEAGAFVLVESAQDRGVTPGSTESFAWLRLRKALAFSEPLAGGPTTRARDPIERAKRAKEATG